MATTKTILSTAASLAASAVLIRTVVNEFLPHPIKDYILSSAFGFLTRFSSKLAIIVHEFNGIVPNEMYRAAETYLGSKISPHTLCLQVAKQRDSEAMEVTMEQGETVVDLFQGIEFKWKLRSQEKQKSIPVHSRNNGAAVNLVLETKFFVLSCHKKHKDRALAAYLPHILQQFKMIKQEEKPIRIYTGNYDNLYYGNMRDAWNGVKLDHPASFETVAMDPEQKRMVKEDLERFVRRKEYYRRVGKAWKRGYLLYGPPGTGKSSLIAAIANFLKFDVYDIELTEVRSNSALRILLLGTANRSIIVIEDIDCTIDLQERKEKDDARESRGQKNHLADDKVTLSGLLNFIDGLWSSCGDERIIIFTTNHKERVDSALLRPGRMDVHIHMSYCCHSAFRTLLSNYHNVDEHPLEPEVQRLLGEVEATPAEVAEELMKSDDCDDAMRSLVKFLQGKKAETSEAAEKEESAIVEGSETGEIKLLLE